MRKIDKFKDWWFYNQHLTIPVGAVIICGLVVGIMYLFYRVDYWQQNADGRKYHVNVTCTSGHLQPTTVVVDRTISMVNTWVCDDWAIVDTTWK